jgi:hypothetical protein
MNGERVVWFHDWTTLSEGRKLGAVPRTEAGWGVVPDAALKDRAAVLLYFDVASYEDAVRGLPPEEVERAVLHRREVFRLASNDVGRVLEGVHSAMAHAAKTGAADVFERLAPIAIDLWTGARFERADTKTLMTITLEADARAFVEARDLPLDQDAADLERRYKLDAEPMAALGHAEYTRALLFVQRLRLCHFAPKDEGLRNSFRDEMLVVGPDWIVGPWPEHSIDALRATGKHVEVIAFDAAPLTRWVVETQAQAERDVRTALDEVRADRARIARKFGRDTRFRQHAVRVAAAARLALEGSSHAVEMARDVEIERSQLIEVYARAPDDVAPSLDAAIDRARADADFFSARSELRVPDRRRWQDVAAALPS